MSYSHYLALAAAAVLLPSCSLFNKGEEDYDTVDGAGDAGYDTSNPYGVPGGSAADSVPYQPVNPPADNPTYSPAAYEDNPASAPAPAAAPAAAPAVSPMQQSPAEAETPEPPKKRGFWGRLFGRGDRDEKKPEKKDPPPRRR